MSEIFKMEQELISRVLGQNIAKIHHVGSTGVPDLLAKPIIDIAVEATSFPPSKTIIDKLMGIKYEYRGEAGVPGRHWFIKGHPRKFNLHSCALNSAIVQNQVKFRDKLITNEHLRRKYETLKLNNYKDKEIDSSDYAYAKSDFIHQVIASNQI